MVVVAAPPVLSFKAAAVEEVVRCSGFFRRRVSRSGLRTLVTLRFFWR